MAPDTAAVNCPLCIEAGGRVIWHCAQWRVVAADEPAFPGFYRVISTAHVVEWSDLPAPERERCMRLVVAVEQTLRERLAPTKINLAALGNVVAHLHWHVIARFAWDSSFPQPIWSAPVREVSPAPRARLAAALAGLDDAVADALDRAG